MNCQINLPVTRKYFPDFEIWLPVFLTCEDMLGKGASMLSPDPRPPNPESDSTPLAGGHGVVVDWAVAREFAFGLAFRICHKRDLADEVAQESAIKLLRYKKEVGNWRALLSTIVLKTSFTLLRREKTRVFRFPSNAILTEGATEAELGPSDRLIVKDLLTQLDHKFGLGTWAIVDFRAQNFSWDKIAQLMRLSVRTCSSRHQKAFKWISEQLLPCAPKESTHE